MAVRIDLNSFVFFFLEGLKSFITQSNTSQNFGKPNDNIEAYVIVL